MPDFDIIKWVLGLIVAPLGFFGLKSYHASNETRHAEHEERLQNLEKSMAKTQALQQSTAKGQEQVLATLTDLNSNVSRIREDLAYFKGHQKGKGS